MEYPKNPSIRLKGKKLYDLYERVFERDNYECQEPDGEGGICGSNQLDKAPHHKIFKSSGGSDTEENLISLCIRHHGQKHGSNYIL